MPLPLHAAHSRQRPTSCMAVAVAASAPCNLENGHLEIIAIQFGVQRTLREAFEWQANTRSGELGRETHTEQWQQKASLAAALKWNCHTHKASYAQRVKRLPLLMDLECCLSIYLYLSLSLALSVSLMYCAVLVVSFSLWMWGKLSVL